MAAIARWFSKNTGMACAVVAAGVVRGFVVPVGASMMGRRQRRYGAHIAFYLDTPKLEG